MTEYQLRNDCHHTDVEFDPMLIPGVVEKVAELRAKYGPDARIEVYGNEVPTIDISAYFERPETFSEMVERKDRADRKKQEERRTYERLKTKFEGVSNGI